MRYMKPFFHYASTAVGEGASPAQAQFHDTIGGIAPRSAKSSNTGSETSMLMSSHA